MSAGSFPEVKRPGRGADHPTPPRAEVKEKSTAIPLLPLRAFVACSGVNFTFYPYEHVSNSEWLPGQSCLKLQIQKLCEWS